MLMKHSRTVATFGQASIVKNMNGGFEVRGGTKAERDQALRWMHACLVTPFPST